MRVDACTITRAALTRKLMENCKQHSVSCPFPRRNIRTSRAGTSQELPAYGSGDLEATSRMCENIVTRVMVGESTVPLVSCAAGNSPRRNFGRLS